MCISLHTDVMYYVITTCHNSARPQTPENICTVTYGTGVDIVLTVESSHSLALVSSVFLELNFKKDTQLLWKLTLSFSRTAFSWHPASQCDNWAPSPSIRHSYNFARAHLFVRGFQSSTYSRCASAPSCALHIFKCSELNLLFYFGRQNFNFVVHYVKAKKKKKYKTDLEAWCYVWTELLDKMIKKKKRLFHHSMTLVQTKN